MTQTLTLIFNDESYAVNENSIDLVRSLELCSNAIDELNAKYTEVLTESQTDSSKKQREFYEELIRNIRSALAKHRIIREILLRKIAGDENSQEIKDALKCRALTIKQKNIQIELDTKLASEQSKKDAHERHLKLMAVQREMSTQKVKTYRTAMSQIQKLLLSGEYTTEQLLELTAI